jgi:hypothetical protein
MVKEVKAYMADDGSVFSTKELALKHNFALLISHLSKLPTDGSAIAALWDARAKIANMLDSVMPAAKEMQK